MARRRHPPLVDPGRSPFTAGSIMNLIAVPILTGIIALSGFYYLTKDTLGRHETEIASEKLAREKVRDDFIAYSQKSAEGIAKLDTRAAVQESQTKVLIDTMAKISDQLGVITQTAPASLRRR